MNTSNTNDQTDFSAAPPTPRLSVLAVAAFLLSVAGSVALVFALNFYRTTDRRILDALTLDPGLWLPITVAVTASLVLSVYCVIRVRRSGLRGRGFAVAAQIIGFVNFAFVLATVGMSLLFLLLDATTHTP